jgi:hypothetical protein
MKSDSYDSVVPRLVSAGSEPAPCRREDLVRYAADRETFLYDRHADVIHVLNPTALAVWELCDGAHSPEQIAAHLAASFADVPAGAADEAVRETLAILEQKNLIRWQTTHEEE